MVAQEFGFTSRRSFDASSGRRATVDPISLHSCIGGAPMSLVVAVVMTHEFGFTLRQNKFHRRLALGDLRYDQGSSNDWDDSFRPIPRWVQVKN